MSKHLTKERIFWDAIQLALLQGVDDSMAIAIASRFNASMSDLETKFDEEMRDLETKFDDAASELHAVLIREVKEHVGGAQ